MQIVVDAVLTAQNGPERDVLRRHGAAENAQRERAEHHAVAAPYRRRRLPGHIPTEADARGQVYPPVGIVRVVDVAQGAEMKFIVEQAVKIVEREVETLGGSRDILRGVVVA